MKLALFGAGGHAREVAVQINYPITFFVDDKFTDGYTHPISKFLIPHCELIQKFNDNFSCYKNRVFSCRE
jgi:hypothetical protein